MTQRVALLGEVEENPLVAGFDTLQTSLGQALSSLAREHAAAFLVPPSATGEFPEFQAVLHDLRTAYVVARTLAEALFPLSVRVGAAVGVVLEPESPGQESLEGPGIDRAADLLYRARKEDRLLFIDGGNEPLDTACNALFLVLYRDMQAWTERQCEVVRLYRRLQRQRAVADHLGVSQQSVSNSLSSAGWKVLAEAEASLTRVFASYPTLRPVAGKT